MELVTVSFGHALDWLKDDSNNKKYITLNNWYGTHAEPKVFLQTPDENSKMTMPYLYMEKNGVSGVVRFPVDLSCESLLSDEWLCCIDESK